MTLTEMLIVGGLTFLVFVVIIAFVVLAIIPVRVRRLNTVVFEVDQAGPFPPGKYVIDMDGATLTKVE